MKKCMTLGAVPHTNNSIHYLIRNKTVTRVLSFGKSKRPKLAMIYAMKINYYITSENG